mgnify:CR=1 FL=1
MPSYRSVFDIKGVRDKDRPNMGSSKFSNRNAKNILSIIYFEPIFNLKFSVFQHSKG